MLDHLAGSIERYLDLLSARQKLVASNIANADTPGYKTRDLDFQSEYRSAIETAQSRAIEVDSLKVRAEVLGTGPEGVGVAGVVVDNREPEKRYLPGHPDADSEGYVAFPRINPAEDMVDLLGAARGYGANVAAIAAIKDMIQRSI